MESSNGIIKLFRRLQTVFIVFLGIYNLVGAISITGQPRSIGVHEGDTLTLDCVVESMNQAYVVWYKEDSPGSNVPLSSYKQIRSTAPEAERLAIVGAGNTYNLRIFNAQSVDESRYQCVAYSRGSIVRSEVARVTVLAPGDSVACHLYPQHVHIGAILNYTCRAPDSLPSSTVSWWRGTERVTMTEMSPDGWLKIRHVVTDMDNYVRFTCIVGDDFTQANGLNCSIVPLHVPMEGTLNPHFNEVTAGSNAAFRCSAIAAPPVNKIKWLVGYGKNSKISGTGGRYEIKTEPYTQSSSTLIIKNVARSDNGSLVRCVMMNEIKQKQIAMAYVIVSDPNTAPPHGPPATLVPMFRPTTRTYRHRTRRPVITTRSRLTTARPLQTKPRVSRPKWTTVYKPRKPRIKDTGGVEISVQGRTTSNDVTSSVGIKNNNDQNAGNSTPTKSSNVAPAVVSVVVILLIIIAAAAFLYFVVFRRGRKTLNKNHNFNGDSVKYKKSQEGNNSTPEERAATRMSLRLQTIEVVVNQPPPEWQSKLTDVKPVGNDYTGFAKPKPIPETPPPAYSKKHSPDAEKRRSRESDGVDRENQLNEEQDNDCVYALPVKKPSKQYGDNVTSSHQNAKRQTSISKKRLLSQDDDAFDDEIEWDQSSWDNSSFEDEEESAERTRTSGHVTEQIYANTSEEQGFTEQYGPTYGNLPDMDADERDPTYSRVADLSGY